MGFDYDAFDKAIADALDANDRVLAFHHQSVLPHLDITTEIPNG